MDRGGAFLLSLLLAAGLGACAPAATPDPRPPAAPFPAPSPVAAAPPAPDRVYESITAERDRQGLRAELDPLLGRNVDEASKLSPVFSGAPRAQIPDGHGGTYRLWHRDGAPWLLKVDASGTVVGYDVPTQGIAGRRQPLAVPLRGERQAIVQGLDDMVGLPIDSLLGDGFRPIDSSKLAGGGRIYTFRTPDEYFLSLGTDSRGVITGWSTDLPGLERPLRMPPQGPR
jgi:hypothetical protein